MYIFLNETYSCREQVIRAIRQVTIEVKPHLFINIDLPKEFIDGYSEELINYIEELCNIKILNHQVKTFKNTAWKTYYVWYEIETDISKCTSEEISLALWLLINLYKVPDDKENLIENLSGVLDFIFSYQGTKYVSETPIVTLFGLYLKENNIELPKETVTYGIVYSISLHQEKYKDLFLEFLNKFPKIKKELSNGTIYNDGTSTTKLLNYAKEKI